MEGSQAREHPSR